MTANENGANCETRFVQARDPRVPPSRGDFDEALTLLAAHADKPKFPYGAYRRWAEDGNDSDAATCSAWDAMNDALKARTRAFLDAHAARVSPSPTTATETNG
jgi:hypothetical protein